MEVVGETIDNIELVHISLNGFTKQWNTFIKVIVGREHVPDWDHLWSDFTQEELQVNYLSGTNNSGQKGEDDDNVYLARKGKAKAKNGSNGKHASKGEGNKKDVSKIKCFICHQS